MKIVMDRNIRAAAETFDQLGSVVRLDGRNIGKQDLRDAEMLIVRSVTRVDAGLLEGTPVRFVGTTTIGTDHLDIPWLEANGIGWSSAPGCNADAASQYTLAIAWLACQRLGRTIEDLRVAIVGCGNVGSRVQRLFDALGAETVANDPPLEDAGHTGLVNLHEALRCDIVCLHTPLTHSGAHPTYRMIGEEQLARMPAGSLLINAGRGDVIHGEALLEALRSGRLNAALDVWPNEPSIDSRLLQAVTVATPHVAGYSDDGKRNGTLMVYAAYCRWAGLPDDLTAGATSPGNELALDGSECCTTRALEAACFVPIHDRAMRVLAELSVAERAARFDRLRRDYPPRRDFQAWTLSGPDRECVQKLERLGFNTKLTK